MVPRQLQIFDFSERRQSNVSTLPLSAARFGGSDGERVLVTRVGDALQEPFWPEGLGINRGFLQVFDCADMVRHFAQARRELAAHHTPTALLDVALVDVLKRREMLYGCTKRISGTNRLSELKPPLARGSLAYRIDPCSRYCHLPPGVDWDGSMRQLAIEVRDMEQHEHTMGERLRQAEAAIEANSATLVASAASEAEGLRRQGEIKVERVRRPAPRRQKHKSNPFPPGSLNPRPVCSCPAAKSGGGPCCVHVEPIERCTARRVDRMRSRSSWRRSRRQCGRRRCRCATPSTQRPSRSPRRTQPS
eukprot:785950-Prymnesium_polylepis.1